MKKAFLVAGFAVALTLSASAQSKKKEPPPPPKPPKPPVEMVDAVPPPPPPAPPPPPPPPAPTSLSEEEIASLPADYQNFLKRNPSVGSVFWQEGAIYIVPKKGDIERFRLDEKGVREAEAKYGKLPEAPPPPPAPPVPPKAPRAPKPQQQAISYREWQ
jgi:hypothetical protein